MSEHLEIIEKILEKHDERLNSIDQRLDVINNELGKLIGQTGTVEMLLKYVVLPLIVILGALVGVKIIYP